MNEPRATLRLLHGTGFGQPPWFEAARLGQRIAQGLRADSGDDSEASWGRVLRFLDRQWQRAQAVATTPAPQPLDDLALALDLGDDERTLLLLAGMADAHEGYGAAFAALHPRGESRPTWGLFSWLVSPDLGRESATALLHTS